MKVTKLELVNFRNYDNKKFNDFQDINIFTGLNGCGKTSILEAIYICSLSKSFKSKYDSNYVKFDKEFSKIKCEVENERNKKKLEIVVSDMGKKTKINGNLKRKISDFAFQFKVVLFSPDEVKFIKDSPNIRRNYINISLSQINKSYLRLLNKYNILIKNKNDYYRKLFINSNYDITYLDILDKKIAEYAYEITKIRENYVFLLNKYLKRNFNSYKGCKNITINYLSNVKHLKEEEIYNLLVKFRKKEIQSGVTKMGNHRDDYEILINGKSVKDFYSQGIQKLVMISLKMSELEILLNEYYEEPILLLDDLFSELDNEIQNIILAKLNSKIQIFITTTDINNIKKSIIKKAKLFELEKEK